MLLFAATCNSAIGMESGDIPDHRITASSFHWPPGGVHSAPYLARPDTVAVPGVSYSAWRVDGLTTADSWIEVWA